MPPSALEVSNRRIAKSELTVQQRDRIVAKAEAGVSSIDLAKEFNCSRQCIDRTLNRYQKTGSNDSRHRSGRPGKLTPRDKRLLLRIVKRNPRTTFAELMDEAQLRDRVSEQTVRRALRDEGLTWARGRRCLVVVWGRVERRTNREREVERHTHSFIEFGNGSNWNLEAIYRGSRVSLIHGKSTRSFIKPFKARQPTRDIVGKDRERVVERHTHSFIEFGNGSNWNLEVIYKEFRMSLINGKSKRSLPKPFKARQLPHSMVGKDLERLLLQRKAGKRTLIFTTRLDRPASSTKSYTISTPSDTIER